MHVTWSLASPTRVAAMLLAVTLVPAGTYAQEKTLAETPHQLSIENKPWHGDFAARHERRLLRVLIPYSRTLYFSDETNRTLFAFAAYNAGPGNMSKIRKEAEKHGLDPNWWLNHVEIVTAERIGIETTTSVRNIYNKYFVAYKRTQEAQAIQRKAREQVAPSAP